MLTRNHKNKKSWEWSWSEVVRKVDNEVEVRWFGRVTNTLMASPYFLKKMFYIK